MRGWAGLLLGRAGQAKEDFARADALAAELDVTWLREDAACGRSLVELLHRELETAVRAARGVLSSDTRLALPVFEALPNEILGAEAFLLGRFREAVSYFERARTHYAAHHLNRAWGTLAKLFHSEALLCLADEEGAPRRGSSWSISAATSAWPGG
ncbi:hypothetical protein [Sorangium sp. So ce693]|uniref:hypothetical protein n=1 Tax=Sorangium sp. So ce693 TaxID=3133318 RepID=UPI003F62A4DD